MTARTLYQKIVGVHTVATLDEQNVLLFCDLHLMNEYTSPQAFAGLHAASRDVLMPGQNVATVSHIIPTHAVAPRVIQDPASALQASNLKRNCTRHGIALFDTNDALQGIEHIIAPEHGMIRPGMVVICGDSHTTTYGALGALGFGIGTSEVEHVLATQTLVYRLAQDMRIRVDGTLPIGTTSKDLILMIISRIGAQGARGYVVEFGGSAIEALSVEARFTLCNMAVEAGARGALIAPDATAVAIRARARTRHQRLDARQRACPLGDVAQRRRGDVRYRASIRCQRSGPLRDMGHESGSGHSHRRHRSVRRRALSGSASSRHCATRTWLAARRLEGLPVQHVFIGSCTNARIEDLRAVARVVKGRRVSSSLRAMVVPGSGAVKAQAEAEGIAQILLDAGFEWRQPGCSMCLAMNDDVLAEGTRCASTTNRNFEGRQGRGAITHLMSPAMAAAAALTGYITDVRKLELADV